MTTTTCTRCATTARASDRFCRGCGLERSALSSAVEQAFADPDLTGPVATRTPPPRATTETVTSEAVVSEAGTATETAEPDTVGVRIPTPRPAARPTPPPGPVWPVPPSSPAPPRPTLVAGPYPPVGPPPHAEPLRWAAMGTAGLLALCLVVDVLSAFAFETSGYSDHGALVVLMLPVLLVAGGAGGLVAAVARRSPSALGAATALALAVVTAGVATSSAAAPGALSGALAVGTAVLLLVTSHGGPAPTRGTPTAAVLAWWCAGGSVLALLVALAAGSVAGRSSPSYAFAAVLFGVLVALCGWCAVLLAQRQALGAWVLAGSWLVDLLAVGLSDDIGHLWPLLVLHAAAAATALVARPVVAHAGPGALAALDQARRSWAGVPRAWVVGGGAGLVVLTGLVLAVAGASSSASSSGSGVGATIIVVLVGLLAFAAACTPTLPLVWRGGLVLGGLVALWIAWAGQADLASTRSSLTWIVLFPALLVGGAVWGAVANHRTGATSTRPGWVGPGAVPPARSIPFLVPPTAGGRSRLCLDVDTALPPDAVLDAVRRVTAVRGNWFVVQGDHVEVAGAQPGVLGLHIGGHCHFRARVQVRGHRTALRVGGMDRWLQSRNYYAGFVPAGFAHVQGFFVYTLFLQTVGAEIARLDPGVRLAIV